MALGVQGTAVGVNQPDTAAGQLAPTYSPPGETLHEWRVAWGDMWGPIISRLAATLRKGAV